MTLAAYVRPRALGVQASIPPSGLFPLNTASLSPLTFYDADYLTNNINAFVVANSYSNNQLIFYKIVQIFNSQGILNDVNFKVI